MIDEEWLSQLDFIGKNGVHIIGFSGAGNEKVVLDGVLPNGERIVVATYKHHLGYHIREVPPFLSAEPCYDVGRLNRKLGMLVNSGSLDAMCSDYDRMYSSIVKWLHTTFGSKRSDMSPDQIASVLRVVGSQITPMSPEALHFILASPGMERRLQEIASLPDGDDARLKMPRINLPNFPIDDFRDNLVEWAERMLRVQRNLKEDAPFEPDTLEANLLYVWGAAALDEFFVERDWPAVAEFVKQEFGEVIENPKHTTWFEQIDAIAHLLASFLSHSNVAHLARLCRTLGFVFAVHDREGNVVVPMSI